MMDLFGFKRKELKGFVGFCDRDRETGRPKTIHPDSLDRIAAQSRKLNLHPM